MYELKTQENEASVAAYLASIEPEQKRQDCDTLLSLMDRATGLPAKMWGNSIVGFGRYKYRYESGHRGEYFLTGFAPRKQALTVYIMPGFSAFGPLMARLGKHKVSKSCLYIKKLSDVDLTVLEELVKNSVARMRTLYPEE